MKYEFVKTTKHSRSTSNGLIEKSLIQCDEMKKFHEDLADHLIITTQGWTEVTPFAEARDSLRLCVMEARQEGLPLRECRRMLFNLENIQSRNELEMYVYNYKLRVSGLSVHSVVRRK